ncbi:MAG TPA: fumarylacetoacetate hydrolase family protein [Rhodocyclaceae bacterium]|nr:fumarylacetoacetate hydrolase family protein [Rhodocyclaceae bacterium]
MPQTRRQFLGTGAVLGTSLALTDAHAATSKSSKHTDKDNLMFHVPITTIPVAGTGKRFQVRRIYCIGRNYAAHAREMGSDPTKEPPFFFQKPTDAIQLAPPGQIIDHVYPPMTKNYHYEVELVAAIGKQGRNIDQANALDYVVGYTVGLDMTRRDLQSDMKAERKPWEIGKSFDHAAIVGELQPVSAVGNPNKGAITLSVNGEIKQQSDLSDMIWSVAQQIAHLSRYYELFPGDIIYSGTPDNVGPVVPGDLMVGHIDGLPDISVKVVSAP